MKKNKIVKKSTKLSAYTLLTTLGTGCTDKFEKYNTNPFGSKPDQMLGDNAITGSLIKGMIPALVQGQQNNLQMSDQMTGSGYGGEITCVAQWDDGGNYYTYNPGIGWYGSMLDTTMPQIHTGYFQIRDLFDGKGSVYQWAQILHTAASSKISDCYGPIPYPQATGAASTVECDSMEDSYKHMFNDLDEAISAFKVAALGNENMGSLPEYDLVFNGDFNRWVKFASSLKLCMAVCIFSVSSVLVKEKAEEAASDVIGVMASTSDAVHSKYNDGMNPYYCVTPSWNEVCISANITSYLGGYSDLRLAKYASETDASTGGGQIGVRSGIYQSATAQANYTRFSRLNIGIDDELLAMSTPEVYFLRAEAALMHKRNMGGTPKELYDTGVTVSMEEHEATTGDYLKSEKVPVAYNNPSNSGKGVAAVSIVTPKYNESASATESLERILIQKWIANFSNGWETWTDTRCTGYSKLFPTVNNLNTDEVTVQRGMRRLPFPQSEYNMNDANVKAAISMLDGANNSVTGLWWVKKN